MDGADFTQAWPRALEVAALAAARIPAEPADHDIPDLVRAALRTALDLAASRADEPAVLDRISDVVGTSLAAHESIPAAFAVAALAPRDPWRAAWSGARLGGDADTVAAIAGAMVGACCGARALPREVVATVLRVNDLSPESLVDDLLALRDRDR